MESAPSPINSEGRNYLPITEIDSFDKLDWICQLGDAENIGSGEYSPLNNDQKDILYTYGANPCVAGFIQTKDNKRYLFHSIGDQLTPEQKELISQSKKGFVGGGKETLKIYDSFFKENNVQVIPQPSPIDNNDFNIVIVKKKNLQKKRGIYYCYAEN